MARSIQEIREHIAAKSKAARDLHQKATDEKRGLTPEEKSQWDATVREHTELEAELATAESSAVGADERGNWLREAEERNKFEARRNAGGPPDPKAPVTAYERAAAFTAWAMGRHARPGADLLCQRAGIDFRIATLELDLHRGFNIAGMPIGAPKSYRELAEQNEQRAAVRENREQRAYQKVNFTTAGIKDADGSLGGYTVPDEMMGPLDAALLQWGGMRQVAKVISTAGGADYPIPTSDDTAQKGEIIGENTSVNEQEVTFGQLILGSYKYSSKMIRVSVELIQDSVLNLPAFLGEALGTRLGRITNDHFTTGTGTSQPRGVVTAAANSGQTAQTAGALKYPEIMTLKHSVDPAYRQGALFMMGDAILKRMKEMADSQGRPLWLPSLLPGEPPTFDGDRYVINQSMPTAAATKGLLYGDFSKYLIREVRGVTLMRLDERYADLHQVGFLAFARYDGDLLNAGTNPVKYLTLA